MISRLSNKTTNTLYRIFAKTLQQNGFKGDIELGYADRIVLATDNSIYQILPEGVIYPRSTSDISLMMQLASTGNFTSIVLSPRGGGTGTNGQSLTSGFMVDTSRYMHHIIEINPEERWASVQAGAVKDYLNEAAQKHGLFFAPELSTSNRATVGGMVNTDASGQGSIVYGKTRHHVLEITSVLADGTVFKSQPINEPTLKQLCSQDNKVGLIHRIIAKIDEEHKTTVAHIFPKLNRTLTGYDLANIRTADGLFDLNSILCGSEGTLAIVSEIKVNLLPIPKTSALVLVLYPSFQASLQDAQSLMDAMPNSIETIDSKVLNLAKTNNIWSSVKAFFPKDTDEIDGINFVEFTGHSEHDIDEGIQRLITVLNQSTAITRLGTSIVRGSKKVQKIWGMRKAAVGLLGSMKGDARPIPFVEDIAVPPENLATFIKAFTALLDRYKLHYGMFGHVDAGVLHVRPAIDMKDPKQAILVRTITDQVAKLAQQHGGILWGEHGKGIRSEYAPMFFAELYPVLQQIKQAFDPNNQLNPNKIATPEKHLELLQIDRVPTRGEHDRTIERKAFETFVSGMHCNGNGACFNYSPNSAMCPTWKATQERTQSPKGRSGLVREWLRLQTTQGVSIANNLEAIHQSVTIKKRIKNTLVKLFQGLQKQQGKQDFSHDVYQALDSCMSCKSCAGQCPVQVNVPDLRSRFFQLYHTRYPRPLKHHVVAMLENTLPALAKIQPVYNRISQTAFINSLISRLTGLTDLPAITSPSPISRSVLSGATIATPATLELLSDDERQKSIIIVQDAFTSYFETQLLIDLIELLIRLGYRPFIAPFKPNGKALHVYGFLQRFSKVAKENSAHLSILASYGVPLVGLDAAVTLTYRDEYQEVMKSNAPNVQLLSEWFASQLEAITNLKLNLEGRFILLMHCTEATNATSSIQHWQSLYKACGLQLDYQPTGCCGMSGVYGHELCNQKVSKKLYSMSWQQLIDKPENKNRIVATGYSCRSQIKRFAVQSVPHPAQTLLYVLRK
ncbi:MAG: FAD-binding and (Fe-S)-binding domain-containing protein [Endozoicomonas sp. (ex Botrylloides leachii)]|nr:FAD-binding and (Fe-S)-binding domain-containing protein [Endozoicomonas sp. (ex Botrylloides leachii)]